jgi:hypothetical protein
MTTQTTFLPISDTIKESWDAVYGAKAPIWGGFLLTLVIIFCIGFILGIVSVFAPKLQIIITPIAQIIGVLFQMGLIYMGIRRARGDAISYKLIFYAMDVGMALRIIGLYILQMLIFLLPVATIVAGNIFFMMLSIGTLGMVMSIILDVVVGALILYISMRMALSMAFVLDKQSGPWEAIKKSFAATEGNVLLLLGAIILQTLIVLISIIPVGIGLIWTIPFSIIMYGMIYKKLSVNVANVATAQ